MMYRFVIMPVIVNRIRRQDKVCVLFLPMNAAMWNYDKVLAKLDSHELFKTLIVTTPSVLHSKHQNVMDQRGIVVRLTGVRCEVIKGFDCKTNAWISIKNFKPDIIFYTQPYDGVVPIQYEYWNNLGSLFCYSPYGFVLSGAKWSWDNALQNYAWRHYVSTYEHYKTCRRMSRIKGANAVPVGYFFEEEYKEALTNRLVIDKVWRNDLRKRVVWAPHKSILEEESFRVSSFLDICDEMRTIRDEYSNRIIFAFKPHPMLYDCLCKKWGQERADAYYQDWANAENSFWDNGEFVTLFAGSDAMIHCSGSFIIDYMYTGKPVQYVYCRNRKAPDFGEIGEAGLNAHYSACNAYDIRRFIEDVVLGGQDTKKSQRQAVYDRYLKSPNGKTFSENVIEDILKGLGKDVLK